MPNILRYKVVSCPHCGKIQTTEANDTFQCLYCKKTRKIKSPKTIGLNLRIHASFDHPSDATEYIKEYKRIHAKKRDTLFESAA